MDNKSNKINKYAYKDFFSKSFNVVLILFILVILIIIFRINSEHFLLINNMIAILFAVSSLGIVCFGQTLLLISGNFDISVGSVVGFAGVILAKALQVFEAYNLHDNPGKTFLVFLIIITICGLVGLINGIIITKIGVNAFITTLAMQWILIGLSMVISGGTDIGIDNSLANAIVAIKIGGVIPIPFIILLVLFSVVYIILKTTVFGKYIYAIGSNENAARYTGLNVDKIKIILFTLSSIFAGIAGIMLALKLQSGQAIYGQEYPIISIAIVVLGGTLISGGKGGIVGTLVAIFFLTVLSNGLDLIGIPLYAQQTITGLIFIIAFYASSYWDNKGRAII